MGDRRFSAHTYKVLRYASFILIAIPACIVSALSISANWNQRAIQDSDIDILFQLQKQGRDLPPEYQNLWDRIGPTCIAFERISLDLQKRIEEKRRYFDRDYFDGLIKEFDNSITREPILSVYILGHYAKDDTQPIRQALALIAIREGYPKKYSIYFANSFTNSEHPILANLSQQIISGKYILDNIKNKFKPSYIETLQ